MKLDEPIETAEPDPKATRNERVKLTATWLNTVGSASVTTGVIAPIVAYVLDVAAVPASRVVLLSLFWLLAGGGLHWVARQHLKGASEMNLLEVYVFALPFIVLAGGAALAYYASRADRERRAP
jgi:hypothetical protein